MEDPTNRAYTEESPLVHPLLTAHSLKMEKKVYKITDSIYLALGFGLGSPCMVVGKDGVVIIDPNEDVKKCQEVLAEFRKITDLPIKAVIITHWHSDHWRGIKGFVSSEEVDSGQVEIIAHERFLWNVTWAHTGGLGPLMARRNNFCFGSSLELGAEGLVNHGIGPDVLISKSSFIPPTRSFSDRLDVELCGLQFHLRHVPSETDDEIVAWMPELKVLHSAEVIQGEAFPNLHTIRGTRYRDPQIWYQSIDVLRQFPAEHMVPAHGRPVSGRENVAEVLTAYRDAIQYVHNQTLRHMNRGLTPDELVQEIFLPPHLAEHPWLGEFYGNVAQAVRQIYVGEVGWFNGDATSLAPTEPLEKAMRIVAMMGGRQSVMEEAQKAAAQNDYQWCAELTTWLIRIDREDMAARNLKANALRQSAYRQINTNWRNCYLTCALELDGELAKRPHFTGLIDPEVSAAFPAAAIVEAFCVRLKAEQTLDTHYTLGIEILHEREEFGLEIRHGVLQVHYKKPAHAQALIQIKKLDLHALLTGQMEMEQAIADGKIRVKGDEGRIIEFFSYFDKPSKEPIRLSLR